MNTLTEKDLRRNFPRFVGENWTHNLALIEEFNALASSIRVTPAQLALAWVLAQAGHVHAIPGTRSIPHFDQNHAAAALEIDAAVLEKAGALMNQQTIAGHRYPDMIKPTIDTEDYA